MKRYNHLYEQICSLENLELADIRARKGKLHQRCIIEHDKHKEEDLLLIRQMLINKTFTTSKYTTFKVYEPKERVISRLPYFPDRIIHHAIVNVIGPILTATFTADTYSCIKGRGVHGALNKLTHYLKDEQSTRYCLQIDAEKFYPSINHDILKSLLRRKINDVDLLWLLDDIIDSAPGLPIGNLLSQYFANFYLTPLDYKIKDGKPKLRYLRYADDIVCLLSNKPELHQLLAEIREYFHNKLGLKIKGNYQIFPVAARGIDVFGYVSFHSHILWRKRTKKRFARRLKKNRNRTAISSYVGLAMHVNCNHLLKKLLCTNSVHSE